MSAIVNLSVPAVLLPVLDLMFLYASKMFSLLRTSGIKFVNRSPFFARSYRSLQMFSFGIRQHFSEPFGLARILIRLSDCLNLPKTRARSSIPITGTS